MKKRKTPTVLLTVFLSLLLVVVLAAVLINIHVKAAAKERIIDLEEAIKLENADCIVVPGCKVRGDGSPSAMLRDRLERAIELYMAGAAPKILMSGDHGRDDYDEVNAMKAYALAAGVPSEDVFMDHAGFSTYETLYRAKEVFRAKKVILVTQEYHLYRAVYVANRLGLEAYGVSCDFNRYGGQAARELREVLARTKDFVKCAVRPEPAFLGQAIPISGNGNLTNDRELLV